MRRRASRVAIFAAVVAGHFLALHFLPALRGPPQETDLEPSLAITLVERSPPQPRASRAPPRARQPMRSRPGQPSARPLVRPGRLRAARPWIDWEKEADEALADRAQRAAQAARRAAALSRWREHVLPGPEPRQPEFRWDYAATHRIVVTPGRGIVININDRCAVIISGLSVLPGCRIGKIPAYGDLFAHMDDPKSALESSVPDLPR